MGKNLHTIQELKDKNLMLLEYITGSRMYGTYIEGKSDIDIKGIYALPNEDFTDYDFNMDWEEITLVETGADGKKQESTYYDIRKFLRLLEKTSPNALEVFNIPDDCLLYMHPAMKHLLDCREKFITKRCYHSFISYARAQIQKAAGQNKKSNWEKERTERKSVLDFCYVPHDHSSVPVKDWLEFNEMKQEHCGLVKIDHMPGVFGLYYDAPVNFWPFVKRLSRYSGLVNDEATATALLKSDIDRDAHVITVMSFNEQAWMLHCDEYKSYQTWLKERNEARWTDVEGHNQKIDGKNLMHMQRLNYMAMDIACGRGIVARRPEAGELLGIRKGQRSLQDLINSFEKQMVELKQKFSESNLPEEVESGLCAKLLDDIRADVYKKPTFPDAATLEFVFPTNGTVMAPFKYEANKNKQEGVNWLIKYLKK